MGPSIATKRHYTPQEVAAIWNVSVDTVIRRFRSKPGVIEIGNDETLHRRRKTLMRIAESVVDGYMNHIGRKVHVGYNGFVLICKPCLRGERFLRILRDVSS